MTDVVHLRRRRRPYFDTWRLAAFSLVRLLKSLWTVRGRAAQLTSGDLTRFSQREWPSGQNPGVFPLSLVQTEDTQQCPFLISPLEAVDVFITSAQSSGGCNVLVEGVLRSCIIPWNSHLWLTGVDGSEPHVNTCYKHFYYFVQEFDLVSSKELEPLKEMSAHVCHEQSEPPSTSRVAVPAYPLSNSRREYRVECTVPAEQQPFCLNTGQRFDQSEQINQCYDLTSSSLLASRWEADIGYLQARFAVAHCDPAQYCFLPLHAWREGKLGPQWLSGYLLDSHQGKLGSFLGRVTPKFLHGAIVLDDAAGSFVSPALSFQRCSIFTPMTLICSQNLAVRSHPNLFTHSFYHRSRHSFAINFQQQILKHAADVVVANLTAENGKCPNASSQDA
ncbi:hypothetical protein PR048_004807 [Dryococelus australis]|uniref:Uncharacterized protein n=1 Tax=Dryococelus australis TaxID=614101 RepID=A0ABQ9I6G0_9NEOP|nr:hypothetical protein PR048_004807 [Dryococelus australis]